MSSTPIRFREPWRIHKRCSEPDRWLDEMGFFRKHIARDSSCLFRAVSENVYNTQRYFHKVRLDCVQFIASKKHLFERSITCPFENYIKEMCNASECGGLIEITAMSHLYRRDFVIFDASKGPQTNICNGYENVIYLFHSPETKHFDVVYTKDFINASSFCQSLIYEMLYDGVYQLKDLSYAVDKMLHDKVPTNHIEYFMSENVERRKRQKERAKMFMERTKEDNKDRNNNAVALKCKHHMEDLERASLLKESLSIFVFNRSLVQLENVCMNCLNVNSAKDLIDNGITPFPYKVAKALDPNIYRNIEFDVWSELRRELHYGVRYCDGTTLQVGVKCLCKLQPEQTVPYHCHIQEMGIDGGPCLVFIEELGEKQVVNYDQLEPLPTDEIRPWAPPYRHSRASTQLLTLGQMLQQIGNIARKQVLKVRNKPKSSEEPKVSEKTNKQAPKLTWEEENGSEGHEMQYVNQSNIDVSAYQYLDFHNFAPMPVEFQALPLMVDCRAAGAAPHDLAHGASNGTPAENHHTQGAAGGELPQHGGPSPATARASTPATTSSLTTYAGGMNPAAAGNGGMNPPATSVVYSAASSGPAAGPAAGCPPYMCGVKSVVWCAPQQSPPPLGVLPPPLPPGPPLPPAPHMPPPPHGVNVHVHKSMHANGADLPMNDIPTLRYYFNLGVECMWAAYGPPPPPQAARHYTPRDLAQDLQQISLHDRQMMNHNNGGEHNHKHKQPTNNDKPQNNNQGKGNGQRPLLGPRFKRGGNNQDGNQSNNQNKGHNNSLANKGPNNRRNSHTDQRGAMGNYGAAPEECVLEQPVLTLPYIPYPPPLYPIPYYPVDSDPAMMGMMGSMGYVGYDEGVDYGAPLQYYGPPPPAHSHPHAGHPHPAHLQQYAPHAPLQHPPEHK